MGDEHIDTIPATKSNQFIKSGVENLIPIPSESEGIPEHMCDVPFLDNSPPLDVSKDQIEDFSKSNEEFSSTDGDSFSIDKIDYVEASPPDSELVSLEVMEIVIPKVGGIKASNDNPIPFYDPIISGTPPNLTPSGESDFFLEVLCDAECESDSNDDQSSSDEDVLEKIINSLLDEFAGELTILISILLGIDETDCDFEEDIRLIEKLLYDNSSSRPPEEFVSANSDAKIKSFSPSPILVKDSDSLMEEIDLFYGDTGILNIKMMGDISDQKAFMHKLMITLASHHEKSPDLLSYRCGTVKKFNTHRSHLNICPMLIHGQNNPPLDVL
nr:hypothetical protein [Tanacetum cinerariifolium]